MYIFKKSFSLSSVCSRYSHEYKKIFTEKDSIEILKVLNWINNIEEYQKMYNFAWKKK